ncbi:MYB DNA-binding domain-protein [Diplogelasinospora grovesii]|uniref:MYB DNA-binding domain-protein n=1 Tax=Diplogelasinospora grovesii TaxID=303347 RepID=A0AAN6NJB8_9PEZI|nr:MYB DNA-binding domain-protein [Diplogelasinospora grovesii]
MRPHTSESPAKKQSKWSPEEDALIIELRGSGMKWDDISKRLPGRSAISCRLHYQNYLERRSEWDEERKNKLARLYERFKPEMWAKVAEEMQIPWRAAEAMHWQLGEYDMARRAGVIPFTLSDNTPSAMHQQHRPSPSRGHAHSQSQGNMARDMATAGLPSPRYGRGGHGHAAAGGPPPSLPSPLSSGGGGRPPARTAAASRRDSMSIPPPQQRLPYGGGGVGGPLELGEVGGHGGGGGGGGGGVYGVPGPDPGPGPGPGHGPGLAPIHQPTTTSRGGNMLPSVAELTTGISPYSTPAYSAGGGGGGHGGAPNFPGHPPPPGSSAVASPVVSVSGMASPGHGPVLPAISASYYPPSYPEQQQPTSTSHKVKRRASNGPETMTGARETSRRRHHLDPLPPPPPSSRAPYSPRQHPQQSPLSPPSRRQR